MGTISSVDLRQHHPDLLAETADTRDLEVHDRANLVALDREIRAALDRAAGEGAVAVNVMKAGRQLPHQLRVARWPRGGRASTGLKEINDPTARSP